MQNLRRRLQQKTQPLFPRCPKRATILVLPPSWQHLESYSRCTALNMKSTRHPNGLAWISMLMWVGRAIAFRTQWHEKHRPLQECQREGGSVCHSSTRPPKDGIKHRYFGIKKLFLTCRISKLETSEVWIESYNW